MATNTDNAQNPILVNELLCFVSNRMNNTPMDVLSKMCCDFYSNQEIESAKLLLLSTCQAQLDALSSSRRPTRRGANKAQAEMRDIYEVLQELGTSADIPCFVAADLGRLPVLGMGAVNLAAMVADISDIKAEMAVLKAAMVQSSSAARPPSTVPPIPPEDAAAPGGHDVDLSDGDSDLASPDTDAASSTENDVHDANKDDDDDDPGSSGAPVAVAVPQEGSDNDDIAAAVDAAAGAWKTAKSTRKYSAAAAAAATASAQAMARRPRNPPTRPGGIPAPAANVNSKRPTIRESGIEGCATKLMHLQAARPHAASPPSSGGLFVTHLRPGTEFGVIKDHIFKHTGLRLKCIPLRSRNDFRYASFRVLCNNTELKKLMAPTLWPKGVFLKEFEER